MPITSTIDVYNLATAFSWSELDTENTSGTRGALFLPSSLFAPPRHPPCFHSSLFCLLDPRNSGFPSRAWPIPALPSLVTSRIAFRPPSKQPPPADKTQVVNSTRRKPTHLSLSTTRPPLSRGKPGVFLKFLRPPPLA